MAIAYNTMATGNKTMETNRTVMMGSNTMETDSTI
jgi:hypothetical protein